MALKQKSIMAYGWLGFWAGIATGFILQFVSQIVSMIPGVSLDLQSISITTTGLGGVIGTGLSDYAKQLFGLVPFALTIPEFIFIGIGGALFVMLGAYVADWLKLLKGSKQKQLTTIFVIGGIVSGWLLTSSVGLPALGGIIVMIVDAYILALLFVWIDTSIKTKLIP